VLAVTLGLGGLLARLARAWRSRHADCSEGRHVLVLWALASAGLFSIYVGQEFLEGLLATDHWQGLAAVLGNGGLWALPASCAVGGLLALMVRGGRAFIVRVAWLRRRRPLPVAVARAPQQMTDGASLVLPRLASLSYAAAGRAPPAGVLLTA
jgi:hypothetical protein